MNSAKRDPILLLPLIATTSHSTIVPDDHQSKRAFITQNIKFIFNTTYITTPMYLRSVSSIILPTKVYSV